MAAAGAAENKSSPFLCGWLQKKGDKGLVKLWRKRWFVLHDGLLNYYDSSGDAETDSNGAASSSPAASTPSASSLRGCIGCETVESLVITPPFQLDLKVGSSLRVLIMPFGCAFVEYLCCIERIYMLRAANEWECWLWARSIIQSAHKFKWRSAWARVASDDAAPEIVSLRLSGAVALQHRLLEFISEESKHGEAAGTKPMNINGHTKQVPVRAWRSEADIRAHWLGGPTAPKLTAAKAALTEPAHKLVYASMRLDVPLVLQHTAPSQLILPFFMCSSDASMPSALIDLFCAEETVRIVAAQPGLCEADHSFSWQQPLLTMLPADFSDGESDTQHAAPPAAAASLVATTRRNTVALRASVAAAHPPAPEMQGSAKNAALAAAMVRLLMTALMEENQRNIKGLASGDLNPAEAKLASVTLSVARPKVEGQQTNPLPRVLCLVFDIERVKKTLLSTEAVRAEAQRRALRLTGLNERGLNELIDTLLAHVLIKVSSNIAAAESKDNDHPADSAHWSWAAKVVRLCEPDFADVPLQSQMLRSLVVRTLVDETRNNRFKPVPASAVNDVKALNARQQWLATAIRNKAHALLEQENAAVAAAASPISDYWASIKLTVRADAEAGAGEWKQIELKYRPDFIMRGVAGVEEVASGFSRLPPALQKECIMALLASTLSADGKGWNWLLTMVLECEPKLDTEHITESHFLRGLLIAVIQAQKQANAAAPAGQQQQPAQAAPAVAPAAAAAATAPSSPPAPSRSPSPPPSASAAAPVDPGSDSDSS